MLASPQFEELQEPSILLAGAEEPNTGEYLELQESD